MLLDHEPVTLKNKNANSKIRGNRTANNKVTLLYKLLYKTCWYSLPMMK